MENSDREIARRVLSAVLERLSGDARPGSSLKASVTADDLSFAQSRLSNGQDSLIVENATPIIFIVVNQEGAPSDLREQSTTRGSAVVPDSVTRPALLNGHDNESRGQHPGLERFPIAESEPAASAPKNCFMEPGRVCVNSGACEMRGY